MKMTFLKIKLITFLGLMSFNGKVWAEKLIQFHTTNIEFLAGQNYKVGEADRAILTFEHANAHKYGDMFLFIDHTIDTGTYGEFSPRFSLSKMTGSSFRMGIIKDVSISTTYEFGKDISRFLYGAGVDLNIHGFNFLRVNFYQRNDPKLEGSTHQLTLAWNRPFKIGNANFLFEGFADFAGAEGTSASNELVVPRLMYDIGESWGKAGKLQVGIEFQYWHNKFGIKGVTEAAPQFIAKWIF